MSAAPCQKAIQASTAAFSSGVDAELCASTAVCRLVASVRSCGKPEAPAEPESAADGVSDPLSEDGLDVAEETSDELADALADGVAFASFVSSAHAETAPRASSSTTGRVLRRRMDDPPGSVVPFGCGWLSTVAGGGPVDWQPAAPVSHPPASNYERSHPR